MTLSNGSLYNRGPVMAVIITIVAFALSLFIGYRANEVGLVQNVKCRSRQVSVMTSFYDMVPAVLDV